MTAESKLTPIRRPHHGTAVAAAPEEYGIFFEFATDRPGFTADETVGDLGASLGLPKGLEDDRESTKSSLPPLETDPVTAKGDTR